MQQTQLTDVLILGAGTAATNAARAALRAGAQHVHLIHPPELINTCVEEGCMPSKSILAGAHTGEILADIETTRNAHIDRLRTALLDDFAGAGFQIVAGTGRFVSPHEVMVTTADGVTRYTAEKIIIATGSEPFVPPIPGVTAIHKRILISDDVVSERSHFAKTPKSVLVVGAGPIGLELATFFHDMGTEVTVLNRSDKLLPAMDPEFGEERYRASKSSDSFTIHLNANILEAYPHDEGVTCNVEIGGEKSVREYEYVLIATGRRPRIAELNLAATNIALSERGQIIHDQSMRTSMSHIFVAGDVSGHHQILHYAAAMGKVAGTNAATDGTETVDYDRLSLAISFDQFPSAFIGLTETVAKERGLEVITAVKHFNSIGLGILKRQEYGIWKLVVQASTGKILGSQVLGPSVSGELVQLIVPLLANQNTVADIMQMTWYHPTYAEILYSLARDICKQDGVDCPGM